MWDEMAFGVTARSSVVNPSSRPRVHGAHRPATASAAVLTGQEAGMVVPIGRHGMLIGRDPAADLVVAESTVSPRHARVARDDDGAYWIVDLTSTHGTFIGRRRVWRALLTPDQSVRLGPVVRLRLRLPDAGEEERQRARYEAAVSDPVTGKYNRTYFVERLAGELSQVISKRAGAALLFVDIDELAEIYRRHGLPGGDGALHAVAERIAAVTDAEDVIARLAGDTLAVLVPGADSAAAVKLARRIRGAVALRRVALGSEQRAVTVCIGAVALDELGVTCCPAADLMAIARARVADAKRSGPNRVAAMD